MAEKHYLDEEGLEQVAGHVNSRLKTVTTMPVSANEGAVRLYVGTTDNTYTKGHTYQYQTNAWVDISGSGASVASEVSYDNTTSELSATNVQDAIDELKSDINNIPIIDNASDVNYDNTESQLEATNVQNAIDELKTDINNVPVIDDAADVNYDNTTSELSATNVQDAIDEVDETASQALSIACAVDADVREIAEQGLAVASVADVKATENAKNKLTKTDKVPTNPENGDVILWVGNSGNFEKGHIYQYSSSQSQWNDISGVNASLVEYDNSFSELNASNVQDAIDEVKNDVDMVSSSIITSYNNLQNKPSINGVMLVSGENGEHYHLVNRDDFDKITIQNTSFPTSYTVNVVIEYNNTLYVGTNSHGIYTSTNGSTFIQNTSFPTSYTVNAFYIFNNTLYVGTANHGIFISTDGNTFIQNNQFPATYIVNSFYVFNNTLYIGTENHGIYTSMDGSTFIRNTSFSTDYTVKAFIKFNNALYVGTVSHGIYTSIDDSTFTQNESLPTTYIVNSFYIFNNTLYVGTNSHGIYTSTDGSTFTQNTSLPTTYHVWAFIEFNNILYVGTGGNGIYTSTDGETFTQNTSFPTNYYVEVFIGYNNTLYVGTYEYGIYTFSDSEMMNKIVKNLNASLIPYSNTESELNATNIQDAIDEVKSNIITSYDNLQNRPSINGKMLVANADGKTYRLVNRNEFAEVPNPIISQNTSFSTSYSVGAFIEFNNILLIIL